MSPRAIALTSVLALAGCASAERSPDAPINKEVIVVVTLSASQPKAQLDVAGGEVRNLLEVPVVRVENTRGEAVTIAVLMECTEQASLRCEVGQFSLYPPDRPGTFTLRVPAALVDEAKKRTTTRLFIELEAPPESVELAIGAPVWRNE